MPRHQSLERRFVAPPYKSVEQLSFRQTDRTAVQKQPPDLLQELRRFG